MKRFLPLVFFLFVVTACAPQTPPKPEKTQLEIRQFQTRKFDQTDMRQVMKSLLNVLQDDGFIVKNVALDLGFLTASKEIDIETSNDRFWAQFTRAEEARWPKYKIVEATINITEFGSQMRVRANFQSKVFDNRAAVVNVEQIVDETFYQEFFSKVDKGLFLQQQDI